MLTPEYLQGLPDELAALTENLETQLIEDIARRVAKAGEITDTAAYQIMRLKEMGASTEYIKKLLADYTKQSEDAIERMIFDAAQTDSEFYQTVYARTGRSYVPYEYNDYLQQLAVAAVNQTKGELKNLTQSMGFAVRGSDGSMTFKPAAKAYQSAMDKAQMLVSTGSMDYITAVRMAVNDLAASGLRFVDYDSGIRNHADVAARRAILTGVSQMTGKIAEHNAAELGTDVVEVDAHAGARPDHAAWQGKWYSLTGKDKRYPLLSQATGYGTVSGLKGANCRHDFYPVIPGIDEPAYTEEELRNIDPPPVKIGDKTYTYYEAEQRQREMERAIRKTKRQIIAAQASGDTEQFTAKSVLLRRQREQYADFSKKAGLVARNERTQVAEFGRSAGSKSSWAARKAKTAKSGGSGSSGGHAVTVNVPTPADNGGKGKLYRDVGLDKSGGSGIMRDSGAEFYPVSPNAYDRIGNLGVFGDIRDEKIENAMKHILDNVRDREPGTESLALYYHESIEFIKETISENANGVINALDSDTPYISIHNHASGKTFSASDIAKLQYYKNLQGVFVVGNNGSTYGLVKTENYDSLALYELLMKKKLKFIELSDEDFVKECEKCGLKYYRRAD